MPFRRAGRPGLIGTMARTAVVAGTASAVVNRGNQRRDARQQADYEDQQSQAQMADMQAQLDQANAEKQAAAQQAAIDKAVNERMAQQQPAASVPAQAGPDDTMAKLQKLADMKSQGLLSDQEFAAMKGKLLGT
jgi:multidrug efflux pump subunit AcrA (membrane-fusion protein)